ncbi:putative LRR receptor-like serine/threonine-protein kinase IRK [Ananas comosus]|uniref:Putative LRR receptor-like serine/threonine-protein kinase IRK n=1 Tax=Ananas comosus TaxID=4615 RepID=A0A199VYB2_ANACO|nr:putative LRR receptor-like serine/threonine-protein kinase IRK [Ananas comosus]
MRYPVPHFVSIVVLLLLLIPCISQSLDAPLSEDLLGLIVFKSDLADPFSKLASWDEDDDDPCGWDGVSCNPRTRRVVELSLSGFSLSGKLNRGLLQLQALRKLSLARNNFSGALNPRLAQMESLWSVDLSENALSGPIPDEFFAQCRSIRALNLAKNGFFGQIPGSLGSCSTLVALNLSSNRLSGALPSSLWSLYGLRSLDLSDNSLAGEIPWGVNRLYNLRSISLRGNRLNGKVPEDIGGCLQLKSIDFGTNLLYGNIPESMRNLSLCSYLSLGSNSLAGEVPSWIGDLRSLDTITNNLTGPIPAAMANLTNIQIIDLSFNNLTGPIPKKFSDIPHLISFNISHNLFSGDLPSGNFFNTIPPSSVSDNPGICGGVVNKSCLGPPKPIVLNPNSSSANSNSSTRVRSAAARSAAALALADDYYSRSPSHDSNSGKLVMFSSNDPDFNFGDHAILNKNCELGRGGFGTVYKTILKDGRNMAIKKLTVSSLVKSQEDFEREVKKLGKLRHPNLVTLEGYYWTPSLQLLMYEFIPGGSLYKHLHESSGLIHLSWQERFDTILGIARSLAHLHRMNVIHYNLKSSNILIDGSGEAKVADYGLAKLLPTLDRYVLSSKVQSALGYMAPEFALKTVKITEKCDVYGFGVLVLEIVTGRRPVEYLEDDVVVLCDVVRGALEGGRAEGCMDERLGGKFPVEEAVPVVKLGLICTSQVPSNRPEMTEVVKILEMIRCPQDSLEEELG